VDVNYGPGNQHVQIAVKKEFYCEGDVDTLIKLKLYRVFGRWVRKQLPPGCESILNMLSQKTIDEIIIKGTD
jgi:hypothetical protein